MEEVAMSTVDLQICHESNSKDISAEIINLHDKISQQVKSILPKIMRIGELLVEQKQKLPHGQFTKWVEENLPFTIRTAQNYMKVFFNKERLKNENISLLSDCYNILKLPQEQFKETGEEDEKKVFITISVYEEHKDLFKDVLDIAKQLLNTESNSAAIMYIMYDWGSSAATELIQE
jgi:hypothetical protein